MDDNDFRKVLYRKIEVGRKQIPYLRDDDDFHQMLMDEFGVGSRKDMSMRQLKQLVHHLESYGAVFTKPKDTYADWIEITDSMPFAKEKRQILAIWHKLGYSMGSLNTRCKREFGVPVFVWIKDKDQIATLLCDLQKRESSYERKLRRGRAR